MAWTARTTARCGRRRLTVAAAAALTALTLGIGGAAAGPAEPAGDAGRPPDGFLLERGRFKPVSFPPGLEDLDPQGPAPFDLNDRSQIVGYSVGGPAAATTFSGFLRDARGRLTAINRPGAVGTAAFDINNRGQIVGVAPRPEDLAGPQPSMDMPAELQRLAG